MSDFSKEELAQLFAVFRDQSLHILEDMSQDLLALESKGFDGELIARLRRAAHTIKGDSACIGLDGVTEIAHKIEDVIDLLVNGKVELERGVVDLILDGLDAIRATVECDKAQDIEEESLAKLLKRIAEIESGTRADGESPRSGSGKASEVASGGSKENVLSAVSAQRREYVRVEAARIDALLNLAGEMVIARSAMNQIGAELEHTLAKAEVVTRFGGASMQLGKLIAELQKSVLKMRMVTIDHVFKRFARPMRELAAERGKQVNLELRGGETELDRTLVDLLYEPLLHLLRNAVDHGLETTERRRAAGKPPAGSIGLRAYHEGNQVVVEISDDGKGIDVAALKARAVETGAVSQSEAERMGEEDALELIFQEGLSTAEAVTRISGRGVGAAAVKSAVEQMRGSISVKSEAGVGTTFTLRMPLTLAIIRALLFTAGGQLFALPLLAISEIARGEASELVSFDEFESFRLRDRFISLVRPGAVLGFERRKGGRGAALRGEAKRFFVIVLAVGNKKYGVIADALHGEQELVIKPMDAEWVHNEALAGASVLGDGRVVLILDAGTVFRKAIKFERDRGSVKGVYAG